MRILIHAPEAQRWQRALRRELRPVLPGAEIVTTQEAGEGPADILVVWKPPASLLACQDSSLKAILNAGAGVDALLNHPELPDVPIARLRDAGMGQLMADYALYGILHFYRDMDRYRHQQLDTHWQAQPLDDRSDWRIGIVGLGTLGQACAQRIRAQGFDVQGWSRSAKHCEGIDTHHGDAGLTTLLNTSRVIINLLPDTPGTRGLLNEQRLGQLPEGAVVINVGRGTTLDPNALLTLLERGHLRGAMLDVFPDEPLPAHHPLWQDPRVIVTPHIAAPTDVSEGARQFAADILALTRGDHIDTVDPATGY
ncbi:glyoxylate/hydroxypyruvate reductase A [Kushneria pakistanensis]|uniref:Glyoxylate/hydroxypyruvate reductase A n=1 Tax=Kushneria pakistanensis TaxID=1508770 RepID=A0ABQ3F9P0_9GAMM|nr:glyoxylate/hydroxypyruvate reductase A [Kushneria pakistanensis]GHC15174.1 glyoxylate/hydroxypyruvate reductase A [Kushneria pakistanensis]